MKKFLAAMLVLVMLAAVLTGCGNEKKVNEVVKVVDVELTVEDYAFGVDKKQPDLLVSVNTFIKEIQEDGTFDSICDKYFGNGTPSPVASFTFDAAKDQLVVATNAAFAPFEYTENGEYYGIDMELAALLAEYLGKELVIQNMDFEMVCQAVGDQQCDIAMAGLTVREDREEFVNFSRPYYSASQKLVVPVSDTTFDSCKSAAEVEAILNAFGPDIKIGVQKGTTGEGYVLGDEDMEFPGYAVTAMPYRTGSIAVQAMVDGEVNYVIIDSAPADMIAQDMNTE